MTGTQSGAGLEPCETLFAALKRCATKGKSRPYNPHRMILDRRSFMSVVAAAAAMPQAAWAQAGSKKVALYAAVGAVLTQYDVDVDGLTLKARGSVTLPANVQYAWPHASHRYLYAATSSSAAGTGPAGTVHHLNAFRIDPASGALTPHGSRWRCRRARFT